MSAAVAPPVMPPVTISTEDAAIFLRLAPRTLANLRGRGQGPPYVRCHSRISYRPDDLREYAAGCRVVPGGAK